MKPYLNVITLALAAMLWQTCTGQNMNKNQNNQYSKLTPDEKRVIIDKGTEVPFSGKYYNFDEKGTYLCRQCNAPLFYSSDKFDSGCGWPSFDQAVPGAVRETLDRDGIRTEITCAQCGAHLGHVFRGEGFTPKNVRHCVNSISLQFDADTPPKTQKAYFAGGCFWGVEFYMQNTEGVISTTVGYAGGHIKNPSYEDVCRGATGHVETVEVVFDPEKTSYEKLAKLFLEIHDPTQENGQGPDIGDQYLSRIFTTGSKQEKTAGRLLNILREKGYPVKTRVTPIAKFWPAESYHQDYYQRTGKTPYCHMRTKRF